MSKADFKAATIVGCVVLTMVLSVLGAMWLSMGSEKFVQEWRARANGIISCLNVGPAQEDECMAWAIGEDWQRVPLRHWADRWRCRHPELVVIKDSEGICESMGWIGQAWKDKENGI